MLSGQPGLTRQTLIIVMVSILVLLALTGPPLAWLIRRTPTERLRRMPVGVLWRWWIAATVPWAALTITVAVRDSVIVSITTPQWLILGVAATIVLYTLLVTVPLGAATLTVRWLRVRRGHGSAPDGRESVSPR